jgi:hypothetical protein
LQPSDLFVNWESKPIILKVDHLLAQYLYKHKRLSLYGIGIFTLDDSAVFPDESAKVKTQIEGVSFISKSSATLDDSLIEYIKSETGKMKALAEADLDSYVALAHQFLNIGKPFYFEGIGTLQKNKDGSFSFNAGTAVPIKTEEGPERYGDPKKRSSFADEKESSGRIAINPVKLIMVGVVLVTIALIGWGGYYLYNKNTSNEPVANESNITIIPDTQVVKNSMPDTNGTILKDSVSAAPPKSKIPLASTPEGGFKFILETTDKKARALHRYSQIKGESILKAYHKIQMETKDSVTFKIFMIVPCSTSDTTRYKDSLNAWYYGGDRMKVKIEH